MNKHFLTIFPYFFCCAAETIMETIDKAIEELQRAMKGYNTNESMIIDTLLLLDMKQISLLESRYKTYFIIVSRFI